MKRFKGFNPMLFAAAVIFLCVTVYSLVSNVTVYVRQRNWPVTTATVIDVAENGKEYNITYQYEARGNVYTGKLHRVRLRYGFGETLTVRYDPDAPEKSVRQGAMTRRSILTQAGLSVVFCLVGYCLIRRALPQKEPEGSSSDTGEWPDARDRITRIRGGKLTVSDDYGWLSRELEAITADYEAGPDAYAENKAASDEMLREACRVEWIG